MPACVPMVYILAVALSKMLYHYYYYYYYYYYHYYYITIRLMNCLRADDEYKNLVEKYTTTRQLFEDRMIDSCKVISPIPSSPLLSSALLSSPLFSSTLLIYSSPLLFASTHHLFSLISYPLLLYSLISFLSSPLPFSPLISSHLLSSPLLSSPLLSPHIISSHLLSAEISINGRSPFEYIAKVHTHIPHWVSTMIVLL